MSGRLTHDPADLKDGTRVTGEDRLRRSELLRRDRERPLNDRDLRRMNRRLRNEPHLHITFHLAAERLKILYDVKDRRGARLSAAEDLFNADVFVGQRAVDVGLADGLAHPVPKLKALYGDKVRLVPLGIRRGLFQRLGLAAVDTVVNSVEERALWGRYGL